MLAITIGLFFFVPCVYANVEITELMYNVAGSDTDHEWIEVHNTGSDAVDLSTWYTYDTSHHQLHPETTSILGPDVYAVVVQDITKFRGDWPSYTGLIFQSNFASLGNEGDTIKLKDNNDKDGAIADSVTYNASMGANENGDSLQKIGGAFVGSSPTPGLPNVQSTSSGGGSTSMTASSSTATTTTEKAKAKAKDPEPAKITTNIIVDPVVFAGVNFVAKDKTTGYAKEPRLVGKYVWNFGDGTQIVSDRSIPCTHQYLYPGEYVLTLAYYESYGNTDPVATDRMTITVVPPSLVVSSVGTLSDPYVELANTSKYEMVLSDWSLHAGEKIFKIPEGTVLLANKKIKFSPQITGFTYDDIKSFTSSNLSKSTSSDSAVSSTSYPRSSRSNTKTTSRTSTEVIDLNTLSAQASGASTSSYAWLGLGGLIIIGGAAVFLSRKKGNTPDALDESVHADDMKILE